MESGIYQIINNLNQKRYIGYTNNLNTRYGLHSSELNRKVHTNIHLQNAWNKYGKHNFSYSPIQKCPEIELCFWEHYWCTILKVHNEEFGYNIQPTDPNGVCHKMSDSTKEKMRIYKTGSISPNKGIKQSKEWIEKVQKTRRENIEKGLTKPNRLYSGKGILQLDLEGNIIKEWDNARKIAEFYKVSIRVVFQHRQFDTIFKKIYKFKYK